MTRKPYGEDGSHALWAAVLALALADFQAGDTEAGDWLRSTGRELAEVLAGLEGRRTLDAALAALGKPTATATPPGTLGRRLARAAGHLGAELAADPHQVAALVAALDQLDPDPTTRPN